MDFYIKDNVCNSCTQLFSENVFLMRFQCHFTQRTQIFELTGSLWLISVHRNVDLWRLFDDHCIWFFPVPFQFFLSASPMSSESCNSTFVSEINKMWLEYLKLFMFPHTLTFISGYPGSHIIVNRPGKATYNCLTPRFIV